LAPNFRLVSVSSPKYPLPILLPDIKSICSFRHCHTYRLQPGS
jgi:hypothetical protein